MDGDDIMTLEEYLAHIVQQHAENWIAGFNRNDEDGDGKLSPEEYAASRPGYHSLTTDGAWN